MGLSWELSDTESLDDSGESVSLGCSDDIDDLEVLENLVHGNFLLEERVTKVDLLLNLSSVDLDFVDVGLLHLESGFFWLSVAD